MLPDDQIARLAALDRAAPPGPRYVRFLDDDHCMTASGIATMQDTGKHEDMGADGAAGPELIAATLIQAPPYVTSTDRLWHENADLIVAVRNALPAPLELARTAKAGG